MPACLAAESDGSWSVGRLTHTHPSPNGLAVAAPATSASSDVSKGLNGGALGAEASALRDVELRRRVTKNEPATNAALNDDGGPLRERRDRLTYTGPLWDNSSQGIDRLERDSNPP